MRNFCTTTFCLVMTVFICAAPPAKAQSSTPSPDTSTTTPAATWTLDQAVTSSVHDAWLLSGKNEQGFFAIVKALAELSAQKRGINLPDNKEVGRKFGTYVKSQAQADHDQLLYAIVDRAVRLYGTKAAVATKE